MTIVKQIKNKIKDNIGCIGRIVVVGGSTVFLTACEYAAMSKAIGKICEDIDDDNPATFGQIAATFGVAFAGTAAEYSTMLIGLNTIAEEIEDNWE